MFTIIYTRSLSQQFYLVDGAFRISTGFQGVVQNPGGFNFSLRKTKKGVMLMGGIKTHVHIPNALAQPSPEDAGISGGERITAIDVWRGGSPRIILDRLLVIQTIVFDFPGVYPASLQSGGPAQGLFQGLRRRFDGRLRFFVFGRLRFFVFGRLRLRGTINRFCGHGQGDIAYQQFFGNLRRHESPLPAGVTAIAESPAIWSKRPGNGQQKIN